MTVANLISFSFKNNSVLKAGNIRIDTFQYVIFTSDINTNRIIISF